MRVAVVGAGIAGTLLAWRLCEISPGIAVDVYGGTPVGTDATGASGGLVRGFERVAESNRLAADSLAELRGDRALRELAAYREIGSVVILPPGADPTKAVRMVDDRLPGSATVLTADELRAAYPFRGLPAGAIGVAERLAGYVSPAALRAGVLAGLPAAGATVRSVPVVGVTPLPAVRLADGSVRRYDAVVVAAGAWTPTLLAASGLPCGGFRTKQIQYSMYANRLGLRSAFDDGISGLYGRPADGSRVLLGLPCDRWDVDPAAVRPDTELTERLTDRAGAAFGVPLDHPVRTVVAFDCYHEPPGLALRAVASGTPVLTFTGGSGGAAKTVLAASREAATVLLGR